MAGEGSYPSSIHPASSNRWVVPSAGLEPARPYGHLVLSQACLPVSPQGDLLREPVYHIVPWCISDAHEWFYFCTS